MTGAQGRGERAARATLIAAALLVALAAAAVPAGAARIVTPKAPVSDQARADAAVLTAADLPGAFAPIDASTLAFLTAVTGVAACDPSTADLKATALSDSRTYRHGPLIVASRVTVFPDAAQAGEALVRVVRTQSSACVARRVSRLGFKLTRLEVADIPSLGVGAVRFHATVVLPGQEKKPLLVEELYALRGRSVLRLLLVAVVTPPATTVGPQLLQTMARRLPAA